MTIVAVRKYKDKIEIASDSQSSWGDSNKLVNSKNKMYEDSEKIFEVNDMIIGCSGLIKGKQYLKNFCKTHQPKEATEDSILDFLIEFATWFKTKDETYKFDEENDIIIVYKKKIFFCEGLCIEEVREFAAVGSGMFLALGALYFGKTVDEAVEVAKEYDSYCSGNTYKKIIKLNK